MTAVYCASAYSRRSEMARYAARLRRDGVMVTSRWHDHPDPIGPLFHVDLARIAATDRDDLERAQCLVLFNSPPGAYDGLGGSFVELGYALALGLRIVVVSHRSSVYEHLPEVVFCETPDAARVYLAGLTLRSNGRAA